MNRRGLTLIEVMITLTLTAIVVMLSMALMGDIARHARGRLERAGTIETLRAAAAVLDRELWSVGRDSLSGGDLSSLGSTGIVTRAMRATGIACRLAPDTVEIATDSSLWFADRQPVPGRDSLLLYIDGDSTTAVNGWLPLPIAVVGPASCPLGGAALRLVTSLPQASLTRWSVAAPTLVRTFETIALETYSSVSGLAFGVRGVSSAAVVQPVASPLDPPGLSLQYWGAGGASATGSAQVREVSGVIKAVPVAELAVGFGRGRAGAPDSVGFRIRLRNVP